MSSGKLSAAATALAAEDQIERRLAHKGWVYKSHRGTPLAKSRLRRYLVSDGFHVQYFSDGAMRHRCGRFDLRNVLTLRASTDPDCLYGLDVLLSESREIPPKVTKTVLLDFSNADDIAPWQRLWASAVAPSNLDVSLKSHRSAVPEAISTALAPGTPTRSHQPRARALLCTATRSSRPSSTA